jgi:hypothetical protein
MIIQAFLNWSVTYTVDPWYNVPIILQTHICHSCDHVPQSDYMFHDIYISIKRSGYITRLYCNIPWCGVWYTG